MTGSERRAQLLPPEKLLLEHGLADLADFTGSEGSAILPARFGLDF